MKRLLATCLLLWVAVILGAAAAKADTQGELNAFKELQQSKWDAQKDLQQKDVDSLRQLVAAVDKRVDDQLAQVGQAVDRYGVAATWTGLVVTALLVLGGFLGYRNARSEAKEAAHESAKEAATEQAETSAQRWFDAHAAALQERISALEQKAAHVLGSMASARIDVENHATNTKVEISEALIAVQGSVKEKDEPPTPQLEKSQQILAVRAQELESAESSYSFEDWDTRAHAAYRDKKLEDAAYFWRKAADVPNAGAANVAMVLVNRGVTQGQLNQNEAKIATYDEVVHRFGDATELALREQVNIALNGAGFNRLLQAKRVGPQTPRGQDNLRMALENLNEAIARSKPPNGIYLGNRAYVHYLLGQSVQSETDFAAALRAPENGGHTIYDATLKDLDMHPIPEDQAMRELVERAWAAYQEEVGDGASKDSGQ